MDNNSVKKFSVGKAVLLSVTIALVVGCSSVVFQARREMIPGSIAVEPSSVVASASAAGISPEGGATTTADLGSSFNVPGLPSRLVIPAIGVDAKIQAVGMSWSGVNIGVPTNFTDVGWFRYGPRPGMPGTAVIDGHLDGKYVPQAVFFNLQELKPGDAVEVADASGNLLQFRVTGTELYDYHASTSDIFSGNATGTRLDLITCAGDWLPSEKLYDQRIVVSAELITQ